MEWIIPVVVMIIYAISAILKAREEAETKPNQKPAGQRGTELDRFLEEIERLRREKATAAADETAQPEPKSTPRPVIVVPPRPVVVRPKPVLSAPKVVERPRQAFSDAPAQRVTAMIPKETGTTPSRTVAPALALLRHRKSLASAIILFEVLSPPKCRRR
ncbi:MAG: hypothetical protein ACJ8C4_16110 [Gemmataceae bacterium]